MMPDELAEFLTYANESLGLDAIVRSSKTPAPTMRPCDEACADVMLLWDRKQMPNLAMDRISRSGHDDYFRPCDEEIMVEVVPCRETVWDGVVSLLQGRIYLANVAKSKTAAKHFQSLRNWLLKRLQKSKTSIPSGYISPGAIAWARTTGGLLLPMLAPPPTNEWREILADQRRQSL